MHRSLLVAALLALAACSGSTATTSAPPSSSSSTVPQVKVPPPTTTTTTAPPPERVVTQVPWGTPFAEVGGVTLFHPAAVVERVGFHESNHEGARQMSVAPTAVAPVTLSSRERGTGGRTAADIVVDPATEIRSPVTGTVRRAGTYVLYCDHSDDFLVVAPDTNPAWEVKLLHISGVRVRPGDRVVAAETVVAPRPTQLPFKSQVDRRSPVKPAWPHVHVEIDDPSIPNVVEPGEGC